MGHHHGATPSAFPGAMTRRRLFEMLGIAAAASLAATIAPFDAVQIAAAELSDDAVRTFPVTHVNHISLVVADYARSRDFFADLFGLRVVWDDGKMCALEFGDQQWPNGLYLRGPHPDEKLGVNHIAYAMRDFMAHKREIKREIDRRGFKNVRPDGGVGWSFDDPAGFPLNVVVVKDKAMFPGAASPCLDAEARACADARAVGVKNLSAAASRTRGGLRASAFSHIVLNVPDVATEMAFYRDMLGMKVMQSPEVNGACALRFGQNTLYLRPMASPGPKGFVDHFAFVIDGWNRQQVKTELERHGLEPVGNTRFAWTIASPDGLPIDAAASGLPPHPVGRCPSDAAAVDANLCDGALER